MYNSMFKFLDLDFCNPLKIKELAGMTQCSDSGVFAEGWLCKLLNSLRFTTADKCQAEKT